MRVSMRVSMAAILLVFANGCLLLVDPPELVGDSEDDGVESGADSFPDSGWIDVDASRPCALHQDSSIWCGSYGSMHQVPGNYQALGTDCAVRTDGTLVCGFETDPPTFELPGPFVAVDGDSDVGCALRASGRAHCWPEAEDVAGPFDSIGTGDYFACGIQSGSGELSCWSINNVIFDEALTDIPSGSFKYVDTDDHVGCGVRIDGSVSCWGYDFHGTAWPPAGSYDEVSLHVFYACGARSNESAVCWGDDAGVPANSHTFPPAGVTFRTISTDYFIVCGVTTESALECWGDI
jgi:hypothetical protein